MSEGIAPEAPSVEPSGPLTGWLWRLIRGTKLGRWLQRRFRNVSRLERRGYAVWIPIGVVIGVFEILGALAAILHDSIPWPTISSTVGHLEELWPEFAVVVVGLITVIAFHAVAYPVTRRGKRRGQPVRTEGG